MFRIIISALCFLALTTDGASVPSFPTITAGARSSQIARCTDGEILISFSKRAFFNNQTQSREYILNPVCAPFENPACFKECKWASWCKASGFQPTLTVVTGIGMRNYGPPYGHMLLLYCCELKSTKILGCEFKEENEMFGADVGLFAETNKRNQLNGPAVIRDVFSKKVNGLMVLRVEMCGVQRSDPHCITNAPVPRTGPFELITSPPEVVDSFFSATQGAEPDWRIRQSGTRQIFGFERSSVDLVPREGLPPPPPSFLHPPQLPAQPNGPVTQLESPFGPPTFAAFPPEDEIGPPRPTMAPRQHWRRIRPTRRPPRTRRPRPPRPRWTTRQRQRWTPRPRTPRPPRERWTPRPRRPRPRPRRPWEQEPAESVDANPHQQFVSGPERPPPPPQPSIQEPFPPPSQPAFKRRDPSQVFQDCCSRYQVITPRCRTMCTFDNFSKQKLIQSYLQKTCPVNAKDPLLGCASSFADHSSRK